MPDGSVITRIREDGFVTFRQIVHAATISLLALAATGAAHASEPPSVAPRRISFAELGSPPLELRGTQPSGTVNLGVRGDEVIAAAKLRLRMTHSPALLPQLSHLRVSISDQCSPPCRCRKTRRDARSSVRPWDPRYFSDYNQLRFDLIGHYTTECEDPSHTSLWATLSALSELELSVTRLELRNELGLLPAPFFDRRDNRRVTLPVVLPEQPSREIARSRMTGKCP